jgi:hypothetical protein
MDSAMVALCQEVLDSSRGNNWAIVDDLVTRAGCIFISASSPCLL